MALNKIVLSDGVTELANVKSVTYKEVVNAGVGLRPGCVGSAQIEVEVYGNQAGAVAAGEVVRYYQIDAGGNETLMGLFTAEPSIETKNSYKFLAYDNAQKLDSDFSQWLRAHQEDFPMTVYALVSAACTVAGVTLGSASWPLSTQTVNAFYADGITCRDILSYAAEIACKFVRCHTDGAVYFDWYTATANSIGPSVGTNQFAYKQNGLTYANYTAESLARVAVHPSGEDDVAYIYPDGVTSGNTLHIKNNLLLTAADAAFYNAVAQNVYNNISTLFPYRPFSVRLFPGENPFRAGMVVSAVDIQGVQFSAPAMSMSVTSAAAELESTGNVTLEDSEMTAKELVQLASDIVRINKLKVDWAEIDTAIINYLTANNVTAQNLTIVDENGNVLATYDASGITLGREALLTIAQNGIVLRNQLGDIFLDIEDDKNSEGVSEFDETFTGTGSRTTFPITYTVYEATVTVDGVFTDDYRLINVSGMPYMTALIFNTAPAAGSTVDVHYTTKVPFYHFQIGSLAEDGELGSFAAIIGVNQSAPGEWAASIGGHYNSAQGEMSFVGGGQGNTANGSSSFVGGGAYNHATGNDSAVLGGAYNTATAVQSVVLGGQGNHAENDSGVVFGEYNASAPNCVEIVGNGGGSPLVRSNARTLDWQGNEWLAGGLTIEGNRDIGAELDGMKFRDVTPTTADLLETLCPWEATGKLSLYLVTGGLISDAPLSNTATAYVACFGYSAAHHIHVLMYTSNPNIGGRTFIRQTRNSSPLAWREVVTSDTTKYAVNDTVSIGTLVWPGMVTGSTKSLYLNVSVDKSMENISTVTVTGLTGTMRGPSGYVDGSGNKDWTSGEYTATATKVTDHQVQINVAKSSAFSGVTNNVAVSYWGTVGLRFT